MYSTILLTILGSINYGPRNNWPPFSVRAAAGKADTGIGVPGIQCTICSPFLHLRGGVVRRTRVPGYPGYHTLFVPLVAFERRGGKRLQVRKHVFFRFAPLDESFQRKKRRMKTYCRNEEFFFFDSALYCIKKRSKSVRTHRPIDIRPIIPSNPILHQPRARTSLLVRSRTAVIPVFLPHTKQYRDSAISHCSFIAANTLVSLRTATKIERFGLLVIGLSPGSR